MKKVLLLSFFVLAACGDNDDANEQVCENRLWELVAIGDAYFATYGETEESAGTIEVDQSTYNFYVESGNTNDGSLCWEGTQ